jgi:hypothetical protein
VRQADALLASSRKCGSLFGVRPAGYVRRYTAVTLVTIGEPGEALNLPCSVIESVCQDSSSFVSPKRPRAIRGRYFCPRSGSSPGVQNKTSQTQRVMGRSVEQPSPEVYSSRSIACTHDLGNGTPVGDGKPSFSAGVPGLATPARPGAPRLFSRIGPTEPQKTTAHLPDPGMPHVSPVLRDMGGAGGPRRPSHPQGRTDPEVQDHHETAAPHFARLFSLMTPFTKCPETSFTLPAREAWGSPFIFVRASPGQPSWTMLSEVIRHQPRSWWISPAISTDLTAYSRVCLA